MIAITKSKTNNHALNQKGILSKHIQPSIRMGHSCQRQLHQTASTWTCSFCETCEVEGRISNVIIRRNLSGKYFVALGTEQKQEHYLKEIQLFALM